MFQTIERLMRAKRTRNLAEVVRVLKGGGVVLTACDTVLGLLAPFSKAGIQRLNEIKGRSESKAYITLIPSLKSLEFLIKEKTVVESTWIKKYWPGPLTIVFDKHESCDSDLTGGGDTIAIRYPNFTPLNELLDAVNQALFSTSVNKQGCPPLNDIDSVSSDILNRVDLIYISAEDSPGIPSTIVRACGDTIQVLRQGRIKI